MAKEKVMACRVESDEKTLSLIQSAIRFDFLVYQGKGMNAETESEWLRFLINRRLTEIIEEKG